jgi:hypothetical protein
MLNGEKLKQIAFFDAGIYIVSIDVVKDRRGSFVLVGDIAKSVRNIHLPSST